MAPDSPFPKGGRAFGPIFRAAIGQALMLLSTRNHRDKAARKKTERMAPGIQNQLSRSVLWRTFGAYQSDEGWRGSPIEILEQDGNMVQAILHLVVGSGRALIAVTIRIVEFLVFGGLCNQDSSDG
jgi:hypothetical protein